MRRVNCIGLTSETKCPWNKCERSERWQFQFQILCNISWMWWNFSPQVRCFFLNVTNLSENPTTKMNEIGVARRNSPELLRSPILYLAEIAPPLIAQLGYQISGAKIKLSRLRARQYIFYEKVSSIAKKGCHRIYSLAISPLLNCYDQYIHQ